jgi:hypothetical protein
VVPLEVPPAILGVLLELKGLSLQSEELPKPF